MAADSVIESMVRKLRQDFDHLKAWGGGGVAHFLQSINIPTGSTYQIGGTPTYHLTLLTTPLTSTSWNGDTYSTTAKTLIDLSSVFGVPAGVKAVLVRVACLDSSSHVATDLFMLLSPNNTAGQGPFAVRPNGLYDSSYADGQGIVKCNDDGDIYYQIKATGTNSMQVWIEIWGYWL